MNITYVILTNSEPTIEGLLCFLDKRKDADDKILVLDDYSNEETQKIFAKYLHRKDFRLIKRKLEYSYSEHRNSVLGELTTDYAFFLDGDEYPHPFLMKNIKQMLIEKMYPDLILLPRFNIVKGVTEDHAIMYGWTVGPNESINWNGPFAGDYQTRLFSTKAGLKWTGNLHERIYPLPHTRVWQVNKSESLAIIHTKTIEQQLRGNTEYNRKYTLEENRGQH